MAEYSSEIHKLLKLGGSDDSHLHSTPEGLPTPPGTENDGGSHLTHIPDHASHEAGAAAMEMPGLTRINMPKVNLRAFIIYPVIFFVAFVFFYTVLNFSSLWAQVQGFFAPPQAEQVLGSDSAEYYKWISNYFYAVTDPTLLDPNNDIDKDGLTNYDEFILRTNPIVADSDGDGYNDGMEAINSYNPWGAGRMTNTQKDLASKLNSILINNRISYDAQPPTNGIVAGATTAKYDLDRAGTLSIPKLKISVPLIFPKDTSSFDTDLTKGVIHYPGTALPGENGVIYVSGHSSDYLWKHDPMQSIFAKLNFLTAGDDVFIDIYDKDGKVENFRYKVTESHVYKPDDQVQFTDNTGVSKLNLSTCWPIGTAQNRIVVSAVAVGL